MKVLIAGNPTRGIQWEKYLRKRPTVKEVIVTSGFQDEAVDAVILLDDTPGNLTHLLHIVRQSIPVYFVSRLPADAEALQKIHHASEEAGVAVQFSHWSSFSSMTRWVKNGLGKGSRFIEIQKQDKGRIIPESDHFRRGWMDELAFVISLQNSSVQNLSVQPIQLQNRLIGVHILLRFDNSDVATIRYLGISARDHHERLIQSDTSMFMCDILKQTCTRYTPTNNSSLLNAETQSFDATTTAENSLDSFFRSVKSGKPCSFSSFEALQTAQLANKVDEIMGRVIG